MDISLDSVAVANGGFFTRAQALDCGWVDRELRMALRMRLITRLRQGAYAYTTAYEALDDIGRHVVLARAVVRQQRGRVALTGISAAAVHGLTLWGQDLGTVHVVRLDRGSARCEQGVCHHVVADDIDSHVVLVDQVPVVNVARTVWEVASSSTLESGVCTVDSALHRHPDLGDQLRQQSELFRHRPGSRSARIILRLSDPKAESAGESLSRVLFYRGGIARPELQFKVYGSDGRLIGTSDCYWPECRHLGEFDGKVKYGRLLRPGEEPGDAVFREKRREDEMRGEHFGMSRWIWSDLMPGGQTGFLRRLRVDLERSARLYAPTLTIIA